MTITAHNVLPAFGKISPQEDFAVDLRTDAAFVLVSVAVMYPGFMVSEVVYTGDGTAGDALEPAYTGSILNVTDPGFVRRRWTFHRREAWSGSPTIVVSAVDSSGAVFTTTIPYIIPSDAYETPYLAPQVLAPVNVTSGAVCDAPYFTQDDLLEVVARAYPVEYISGLQARPDGGYEQFQAAALVLSRVSQAIARMECGVFLMTATGGSKAQGWVEFYRDDAADGDITIVAGSVVTTDDNRDFVVREPAEFVGGDLGPHVVAVEAIAVGYEYNVPGQVTTAGGEVLEGEIRNIRTLVTATPAIDRNMRVRQLLPTVGGSAAWLDGLGYDLGVERVPSETDDEYRLRILEVPDTVSPSAICGGVERLLAAYDYTCCLREVGSEKFRGFFYDAGDAAGADPDRNYAYDMDPSLRPEDTWKTYVSFEEMRAFFLVGIPRIQLGNPGLFYDGDTADAVPAPSPWDGTSADAVPQANPWDAFDARQASVQKAVYAMIDAKRAGGVGFDLYVETSGCV